MFAADGVRNTTSEQASDNVFGRPLALGESMRRRNSLPNFSAMGDAANASRQFNILHKQLQRDAMGHLTCIFLINQFVPIAARPAHVFKVWEHGCVCADLSLKICMGITSAQLQSDAHTFSNRSSLVCASVEYVAPRIKWSRLLSE